MALHLPLAIGLPRTPGHLPSGGSAVDERELGGKNSQGNRVGSGDREASVGMDPATEGAALTSLTRAFSLSVRPRCLDPRGGSAPEQWRVSSRSRPIFLPQRNRHPRSSESVTPKTSSESSRHSQGSPTSSMTGVGAFINGKWEVSLPSRLIPTEPSSPR